MQYGSKRFRYIQCAKILYFAIVIAVLGSDVAAQAQKNGGREQTYCNPMDLAYRFQLDQPSRREAADPTLVVYHNEYWLFPSKSGGYWHSKDLLHWSFVQASGYNTEDYAPTALVYRDKLYLTAGHRKLYTTKNPLGGKWTEAADFGASFGDADLFLDDDGKVYMYSGVSDKEPLHIAELDPKHGFKVLRSVDVPASYYFKDRGWETPGDFNQIGNKRPYVEGSWMTKHDGKYYLQYAAPGTQFRTYGDGVLVANNPMGPFTYAPNSPFSFKPTGYVTGAGHSSTIAGLDGHFWHVASMTIGVRHMFERRLGLFPTWFTADGELVTDTYLGDYPHFVGGDRGLTGWMLLSRKKPVFASSSMEQHGPESAVDEDIKTWWSAKTGNPDEWFKVDLGRPKTIQAVQINFADEGSTTLGRSTEVYRYVLETSDDDSHWKTIVDRSKVGRDAPHDYEVLPKARTARFIRIRNAYSPNGANFSISDLRVFGNGGGKPPVAAEGLQAALDPSDARHATVKWQSSASAEFYIVRLGSSPTILSQNYQVYDGATSLDVRSLNSGVAYYVAVDAVNENGISRGSEVIRLAGGTGSLGR